MAKNLMGVNLFKGFIAKLTRDLIAEQIVTMEDNGASKVEITEMIDSFEIADITYWIRKEGKDVHVGEWIMTGYVRDAELNEFVGKTLSEAKQSMVSSL